MRKIITTMAGFIARLTVLSALVAVAFAACGNPDVKKMTNTCNGQVYDFSCLFAPGKKPFEAEDPANLYYYYLKVIDDGLPNSYRKCKFADGEGEDNAAGQAELDGSACYPIGKLSQQTWAIKQNVGNTGQTIVITFGGGQAGRQTTLRVTCDETAKTPVYQPAGEVPPGSLNYELDINSYLACADAKPSCGGSGASSGTAGWIIVGLVIGVAAVYFGGGFAFLHFRQQKQGREAIPHVEFWASLPGLVKDGCSFCISKIRGTSAGPYSKI